MCKRNLLSAIRAISSVVLVVTFVVLVILNINQTVLDSFFRPWNTINSDAHHQQQQNKPTTLLHVVRDKTIHSVTQSKVFFSPTSGCPGEFRTGYCVLRNYYSAKIVSGYNDSVTLSTQGTGKFLKHAEELCKRWEGPVSVAVYAPGDDFQEAVDEIERLRDCGHPCVRQWVSWHLVFDVKHQPPNDLLVPKTTIRPLETCGNVPQLNESYTKKRKLAYPINVARNVARLTATTFYVFASDIELYPSEGIIPKFLKMIRRLNSNPEFAANKRQVFVVRVFEVDAQVKTVPYTKVELQDLYKQKLAVFFHEHVCASCHYIPKLYQWMKEQSKDEINISYTTKRQRKMKLGDWEPFFIGTNEDPLFDERLSWNGKANKMQLALEMCYLDYDFHVLDEVFMVHVPGIKIFSVVEQRPRVPYMIRNERAFKIIKKELLEKYGNRTC